jgi:hypothetical protein
MQGRPGTEASRFAAIESQVVGKGLARDCREAAASRQSPRARG